MLARSNCCIKTGREQKECALRDLSAILFLHFYQKKDVWLPSTNTHSTGEKIQKRQIKLCYKLYCLKKQSKSYVKKKDSTVFKFSNGRKKAFGH